MALFVVKIKYAVPATPARPAPRCETRVYTTDAPTSMDAMSSVTTLHELGTGIRLEDSVVTVATIEKYALLNGPLPTDVTFVR